ncbi:MAG: GNAT family N-acetyltransferase [Cyclobacteriaceae bacterium]|nr:GNAT family N-acetyltransferase [Cyclobacteriaceae bacterium]
MVITIKKIENKKDLKTAQEIRHAVFVIGQHVPVEDEVDVFENISHHYLAFFNNTPVGAARWRITDSGVKLERFSVLKEFRGRGAGSALVNRILKDVKNSPEKRDMDIYLHAQVEVVPLYRKFGFRKVGDMFEESGILHYKMVLEK